MEKLCLIMISLPDALAESVERMFPMRKGAYSIPGSVKPMTYEIDTCLYSLVLGISRTGQGQVSSV